MLEMVIILPFAFVGGGLLTYCILSAVDCANELTVERTEHSITLSKLEMTTHALLLANERVNDLVAKIDEKEEFELELEILSSELDNKRGSMDKWR